MKHWIDRRHAHWSREFGGFIAACAVLAGGISLVAAEIASTNAPVEVTNAVSAETTLLPALGTNTTPAGTNQPAPPQTNHRPHAATVPVQGMTLIRPSTLTNQFKMNPRFRIDLVASEPLVASPVAMAFDEDSRLYVAEMRDYPGDRDQHPHLGQVRILEDPAGEGSFTSSTIFATNLPLPSAVVCYGGGVFVAAAPDIIFLQDTNGNGVADVRRIVFTGFGNTNGPNPDALPHSFYWGLDNRIYGATGSDGALVAPPGGNAQPMVLRGLDFSMDPVSLTLGPESGSAASGLTRDDWNRRYLTSPTQPLATELIEYRFLQRNPFFVPAATIDNVTSPAIAVYSHSPATPGAVRTRQVRTTNVHSVGWLTKARGTVIYRGNTFPTNYWGNAFIADPDAHVIHREVLRDLGLQVRGDRAPDERNTEFIASTDPAFRPTQLVNGPDGALYIADMWRGKDSGRIFRVAPLGHPPGRLPRLSGASTFELVTTLAHTNGWHRDTASRLLVERRDPNAIRFLNNVTSSARLPQGRAHAMYVLASMGALTENQLVILMGDPDYRVRRQAARLAEGFVPNRGISEALWTRLRTLAREPYVGVRYQAALTAGSVTRRDKPALLLSALAPEPANLWLQTAVLSSGLDTSAALLMATMSEARLRTPAGAAFAVRLTDMIGVSGFQSEVASTVDFLNRAPLDLAAGLGLTAALGDGLQRTRSSLALVDPAKRLQKYYTAALNLAADINANQSLRIDAMRLLGVGPFTLSDGGELLLAILGGPDPALLQTTALQALERYKDPLLTPALVRRWGAIPAALRPQAISALLARTDRIPVVLGLLDARSLPPGDFLPWQINMLRSLADQNLRDRAIAHFGPFRSNYGPALTRFTAALNSAGAPARGHQIFETRCSACHTIGSLIPMPGPDLLNARLLGKEKLLQAIVAPSATFSPGFTTVVINTVGGETVVGTVDQTDRAALLVRRPGRNVTVWPRENLLNVQPQSWSLMPEGIAAGLNGQNMADLLQYLITM